MDTQLFWSNVKRQFRLVVSFLLVTPMVTIAQSSWTIIDFELRNQSTFEKHIKPEQWINKTITFKGDTITFDFKGIHGFENDITYTDCVLLEPIDTVVIKDKQQFIFLHNLDKHLTEKSNQVLLLETKPNCYKFPFSDFIICGKKGFIEFTGGLFIMRQE